MKILWFSDWLIPTGLSKVSRYLIQGLRKDFEIAVMTPYMAGSPLILDGLLIFPMLRFDRTLFLSALERFDPDLVIAYISHFIPPYNEISPLVKEYGAKLLWYVPVEYDEVSPSFCFPLIGANLIATPTHAGKRVLEEFIPEDFIHVVPHGVDRSIYKPHNPKPKPQPLSDLFVFGFVGKNNFRKDLPALIEAFARLSPEAKEKSCLYLHTPKKSTAGEVVYWPLQWLIVKNGLEAKVLAPENLTMWEGVEEEKMGEIYGMMDCLVHATMGEGFCLPVLEAMACGIPVIASKNSSLPEVVGDAGILVECDPEPWFTREGWVHHRTRISALRDAMELVFKDEELRGKLARRGLERASEFTWEKACEEMKKAIEKAMKHHRLGRLRVKNAEGVLSA